MVFYIFLRNPNGNRYVLCLYWNDDEWNWNYNWLDNNWNTSNPSAVLAILFISLRTFCPESFVLRAVHANRRVVFRLPLHPDKVFIKTISSGIDFLGWVHFQKHRVLQTTTKRRMLKNLRGNPKSRTVQSYLGLLKHGDTYKLKQKF